MGPLYQLKMYSFMGGGLFCAIVGNILLVVSTATDYWMQYRLSGNYAHQGLWRYCMSNKCYMQTDSIGKILFLKSCGTTKIISEMNQMHMWSCVSIRGLGVLIFSLTLWYCCVIAEAQAWQFYGCEWLQFHYKPLKISSLSDFKETSQTFS